MNSERNLKKCKDQRHIKESFEGQAYLTLDLEVLGKKILSRSIARVGGLQGGRRLALRSYLSPGIMLTM